MIDVDNLVKRYGTVQALDGVGFHVEPGSLFAYLGPNGAGKTTTIRIMTGLTSPTSGGIVLAGIDLKREPTRAKRICGVVFQANNLDNELTVEENLQVHARLFGMSRRDRDARIPELLEYVDLSDRLRSPTRKLSGGMKRRLMIARALLHKPKILFLDEPTAGLDAEIRRRTWALIKQVQTGGTTVFLTTHYIEEAEFLADTVAFLERGRIVRTGSPAEIMRDQGEWALDELREGRLHTRFFPDREAADRHIAGGTANGFTLRRVNLEDSFLAMTGKRVQEVDR